MYVFRVCDAISFSQGYVILVGDKQRRVPLVSACRILQLLVTVSKERDQVSWHEELHCVPAYAISKFSRFNVMLQSVVN